MHSASPASRSGSERIAILGDVHANLEALEAVIESALELGAERFVQTGDVVGYGPDPAPCLHRLMAIEAKICLGNHDAAVLGTLSTDYFNPYARAAVEWTCDQLSPRDLDVLAELRYVELDQWFTLVHGSLHEPEEFGYVASTVEAEASLAHQTGGVCFVGHTHVPGFFGHRPGESRLPVKFEPRFSNEPGFAVDLSSYEKSLVNVGSVGQPRDEDPRAAFVLYEPIAGRVTLHRVDYDVERTQRKILAAGLPRVLADRLELGV